MIEISLCFLSKGLEDFSANPVTLRGNILTMDKGIFGICTFHIIPFQVLKERKSSFHLNKGDDVKCADSKNAFISS